ncbi:MAG: thioredoxin domain-containing protein [Myxococcales bacterium]
MSDTRTPSVRPAWIAVALLAFALCFGVGHYLGGPASDPMPLSDGRVYKVPLSIAQPQRGNAEPLVVIVEWCDLQGTSCKSSDAITTALLKQYPNELRHSFRHLQQTDSADSAELHEFARVAFEQNGKFWEVREKILARPAKPVTRDELEQIAKSVGIDWKGMQEALSSDRLVPYVFADGMFAQRFGVTAGPTFYVNGRRLAEPVTAERLDALVEQEMAHAKQVLAKTKVEKALLYQELTKDGLFQPPLPVVAQTQTTH